MGKNAYTFKSVAWYYVLEVRLLLAEDLLLLVKGQR